MLKPLICQSGAMGYPKALKFSMRSSFTKNFKMGKKNLKFLKAGIMITQYFNEIGQFTATVTPSSAALGTTLFIRAYKVCYMEALKNGA